MLGVFLLEELIRRFGGVSLFGKQIQFLNDSSFANNGYHLVQHCMEVQVVVGVGGILFHNVLDPDADNWISILSEEDIEIPSEILSVIVADEGNVKCLFLCLYHFLKNLKSPQIPKGGSMTWLTMPIFEFKSFRKY